MRRARRRSRLAARARSPVRSAASPPPRRFPQHCPREERAPGVSPAPHLQDRTDRSLRQVERGDIRQRIGLEQLRYISPDGAGGCSPLRSREDRTSRPAAMLFTKRPIVAHIYPTSPGIVFYLCARIGDGPSSPCRRSAARRHEPRPCLSTRFERDTARSLRSEAIVETADGATKATSSRAHSARARPTPLRNRVQS